MSFKGLTAYELLKEQDLADIHSKGYILQHKKMKLMFLIKYISSKKLMVLTKKLEK